MWYNVTGEAMKKNEIIKRDDKLIVKFFSSKTQMICYIILFIIFMAGFIYFGSKDYSTDIPDNKKFVNEHKGANENNVFKYLNASEALSYIKSKDAILFIGITNSENVTQYANILNEVAQSLGIKSINYYDITQDRNDNNATYESIVNYCKDHITYLDDGKMDLYGPTLIIKKGGNIIYFDDSSAFIKGSVKPEEYWTNYEINMKKSTIEEVLNDYLGRSDVNDDRK